ncbi:MAG TPA: CAP domain-containing protein [Isosphaeraceae bacterium]|jgi:uncharacterized protein YkwD
MARPGLRQTPKLERLEAREVMSAGGPGPEAQYMLELINEARTNPAAAAERATSNLDGDTQATLAHFGVDAGQARREIAASPARPALAWDDRLAAAAQAQSQDQANTGVQSHTGSDGSDLGTRLDRAGYAGRRAQAENAFGYARSVDLAMKAFLIDWGVASKGHRHNLLQPDQAEASYAEVGVGIADSSRLGFGPKVVTQDFGRRDGTPARLLGVAFEDRNGDRFYQPGEGRGDVTIEAVRLDAAGQPTGPRADVTTWDAGGYQLPLEPGNYQVSARVGARVVRRQRVSIGADNVKVDYNLSDAWEPPAPVVVPPQPVAPPPPPAPAPAPVSVTAPVVLAKVAQAPAPAPELVQPRLTPPVPEVFKPQVEPPSQSPTPAPAATSSQAEATTPAQPPLPTPGTRTPDSVFGASWITSWTRWTAASALRSL